MEKAVAIDLDALTSVPVSVLLGVFRKLGIRYSPHHVNCIPDELVERAELTLDPLNPLEELIEAGIEMYEDPGVYVFTTTQGPCDYGEYYRVEADPETLEKLIEKLDKLAEKKLVSLVDELVKELRKEF